eukprot:SAG31_NODE_47372_length_247_cov_3.047297_1_plen_26_part_01
MKRQISLELRGARLPQGIFTKNAPIE